MARDIKGEDLSLAITSAAGALVAALAVGIEDFSSEMVTKNIEQENLDGRRVGQTFLGWKGSFTLNLRNGLVDDFITAYQAALASGAPHAVVINEKVFDPSTGRVRTFIHPECVLSIKRGPFNRSNAIKVRVEWETGAERRSVG